MPLFSRHGRDKTVSQEEKRKRTHYEGIQWRDLRLVPNILSLTRIAWAIPALYFIIRNQGHTDDLYAGLFLLLAFLTDVLDGFWARHFKQISNLGRILDPLIDKIVVISTALTLSLSTRDPGFPLWLVGAMVIRDLLILLLALRVLKEDKYLFTSSWSGKAATFAVAGTIFAFIFRIYIPGRILVMLPYIVLALLALSSVDYFEKYWSVKHKRYIN